MRRNYVAILLINKHFILDRKNPLCNTDGMVELFQSFARAIHDGKYGVGLNSPVSLLEIEMNAMFRGKVRKHKRK